MSAAFAFAFSRIAFARGAFAFARAFTFAGGAFAFTGGAFAFAADEDRAVGERRDVLGVVGALHEVAAEPVRDAEVAAGEQRALAAAVHVAGIAAPLEVAHRTDRDRDGIDRGDAAAAA